MNANANRNKSGGILVMAMIILVALTLLASGLFKLKADNAIEGVNVEQSAQAFWLAEAGLQHVVQRLNFDPAYRDLNPAIDSTSALSVSKSIGNGSYRAWIEAKASGLYDQLDYTVRSTGNVRGEKRTVQMSLTSYPGGKYAIIGISGKTELSANVTVDGAIAQIDGDMEIHDSRLLDDYVIMSDSGILTDKKGEAVVADLPPPPTPRIEASDYLAQIYNATNSAAISNDVVITSNSLSGTNYYNNVSGTVIFDSKLSIADDALIVASGDIRFNKSGVKMGNNVRVISGNDISFKVQATVAGGSQIFAVGDVIFESGSGLVSSDPVLIMSLNGDVIMQSNYDFHGIIIAENGIADLQANGSISGTVIGGLGVDASAQITITYDPSVFTANTPVIPKSFGDVILSLGSWQEIAPL